MDANKALLYSTGNSAMCQYSWEGFGRNGHMYVPGQSLHCSPETLTGYAPIQNKKFKVKKKKNVKDEATKI